SGAVSGAIADGVLITLSGTITGTTTTNGGGLYSFSSLTDGNYTLTPSKAGYSFSPASIAGTVNRGNATGQNFTASFTHATFTYATNPAIYVVGVPIAPDVPSGSGGAGVTYSVSPTLPAGLSLDPATGVITGTPTAFTPALSYVVAATSSSA